MPFYLINKLNYVRNYVCFPFRWSTLTKPQHIFGQRMKELSLNEYKREDRGLERRCGSTRITQPITSRTGILTQDFPSFNQSQLRLTLWATSDKLLSRSDPQLPKLQSGAKKDRLVDPLRRILAVSPVKVHLGPTLQPEVPQIQNPARWTNSPATSDLWDPRPARRGGAWSNRGQSADTCTERKGAGAKSPGR